MTAFLAGIARDGWEDSLQDQLYDAMSFLCKMLSNPKPRVISVHDCETPVVLFTDGAWEPTSDRPAGAGWVIVDQVSDTRLVVELEIPSCLVGVWKKSGRSQLIAELELLPVLAAILHHKDLVATRRVLLFVDNNAVRDCLIKAGSRSPTLFAMLSQIFQAVADLGSLWLVSRVPSKSNIADLPRRGQAEQAAGLIKGTVQSSPELSCELLQLLSGSISFASYLAGDGKALKGKGGEIA